MIRPVRTSTVTRAAPAAAGVGALALRGGTPMGEVAAQYDMAGDLVEPVEIVSPLMSRRMLHGTKERAERVEALS